MSEARAEAFGERLLAAVARRMERPLARVLRARPLAARLQLRAAAAWRASEQPLFVCYGNINRSPFAAAVARTRRRGRADSGGLYRESGRSASPEALACARRHGVELGTHRSRTVSAGDLLAAEAIFAFDLDNLARIGWRAPRALARTHLLGSLAPGGPLLIEDPHGRGELAVARAFDTIEAAIAEVEPRAE